ncbi:hypothetical protein HPB52_016569 [Rhipicephalus sanguineus]|uniref:CCHC-type domain-containing protein n=1 Tax=Rhipicephalus sanguineus TaxID=34632 RepID=A0A9D4SR04_RHISA|nr:hypothetical protein HPB52_016569 [Rhipicephalus sanguineus]
MDTAQLEDLPPSEDELLDDMVRIWRRKQKTLASKDTGGVVQQQAAARSAHATHGNAASAALKGETHKSQWRPQQTPRIGRDVLIVVLKPRTTLDLKETFVPGQAGAAVRNLIRECGEVELTVWPVWDQNVLVCGLNSVPAAERLLGDVMLVVGGRQLPFRGHAKASGDVCKGVINIDPKDTSGSLKQKLRWKQGNILCVRKLGDTDVAVVTFEGKRVPRHVYCSDQVIPVRLYKKTIPACHRCGTVGHRADICPRPQSGRCGRCGSQVATTSEGSAEHECTPRCLICGGSHLTGAADCRDKYRKPIKPRLPPTNTKRTSAPKEAPSTKVNKKKSASTAGKPGQVKTTDKAGTRTKTSTSNADDFPPLADAQTKVSGWVGAAPGPLSPSPTEVALQRQNAELRRHTENLAKKIRELEAKLARLTEPQAHGGPSEPMQQTEPVNLDDRASVASDLSSDSQCTGSTSIGHVPIMEHRLENLERTIADMPSKILEGVRASFRELWQRELPHMVESITPAVTDSVLSIVQGRTGVQFRNSRSRSRSPRPDTRRRPVVSRQIIGSQEHIAAASSPETLVPPPEAPPLSGIGPAPNN